MARKTGFGSAEPWAWAGTAVAATDSQVTQTPFIHRVAVPLRRMRLPKRLGQYENPIPKEPIHWLLSPPLKNSVVVPRAWYSTPPCTFHPPKLLVLPRGAVTIPATLKKPNLLSCPASS